jgi:hypothetical protein
MKKQMISTLLVCMTAFLVAGCTSPRAYNRASQRFPQIASGRGRIYFYRGNDFVGGGQWDIVKLDENIAGYVSPMSFFYVDEPPGSHTVSTQPKGWFGKAMGVHEMAVTLEAGETKYIRLTQKLTGPGVVIGGVFGGATPSPVLQERDAAMMVLPKCLYYEGKYHVF